MNEMTVENVIYLIDECLQDIAEDDYNIDLITVVLKLAKQKVELLNE